MLIRFWAALKKAGGLHHGFILFITTYIIGHFMGPFYAILNAMWWMGHYAGREQCHAEKSGWEWKKPSTWLMSHWEWWDWITPAIIGWILIFIYAGMEPVNEWEIWLIR